VAAVGVTVGESLLVEVVGQLLVDDLMSGAIIRFWDKAQLFIEENRVRNNFPQYGEWIEYLSKKVKVVYDKQHPEQAT